MKGLHVTVVTDSYYPILDGVAKFVDKLARGLHHGGHEVTLVVPRVTHLPVKVNYNSFPFEVIDLPTFPRSFRGYFLCLPKLKLINVMRRSDIIIVNSLAFTTMYSVFLNTRYHHKIIHFVHVDERELLQYTSGVPDSLCIKTLQFLHGLTSKIDHFVVATGKFYKRTLDFGVEPQRISRVTFGNSSANIKNAEVKRYREKLGIPPKKLVILYLGRLSDEKNIMTTVEVLARLASDQVHTIIGGTGFREDSIKKRVDQRKYDIDLLGRVPEKELSLLYSIADILLTPSFHESLCFTVIEGMSYAAVPVVNGKYPENRLNKDNAILIDDVTDITEITSKVTNVLNDKDRLRIMQDNAIETSRTFTWSRFIEDWNEIIERVHN